MRCWESYCPLQFRSPIAADGLFSWRRRLFYVTACVLVFEKEQKSQEERAKSVAVA